MRRLLFICSSLLLIAIACNKDKFQTKPRIEIKSYSSKIVPFNSAFIVNLNCFDKEGDVQDSLIIIKNRQNIRTVATIRDTLRYKFPVFPNNSTTEIQAILDYQSILSAINPPTIPGSNPPMKENDTLILRFAVRDKAGNTSDTIQSEPIIVIR
ncbi:MAG TPA: hypothetical protein PKW62_03465 [Chitinophagaceae bacterium]|nr:hypothetical protein [Chitinophagaceae bacterium]HQV05794.1 hypothetical protein [Chitinophagaceae bacterium]